jgi:hypothetical protein
MEVPEELPRSSAAASEPPLSTPALSHILSATAGQKSASSWQTDGSHEVGMLARLAGNMQEDAAQGVPEELAYEQELAVQEHVASGAGGSQGKLAPLMRREHRRRRTNKGDRRPAPRVALRKRAGAAPASHRKPQQSHRPPKPNMPPVTPPARKQRRPGAAAATAPALDDRSDPIEEQLPPPFDSPPFDSPPSPEHPSQWDRSGSDDDDGTSALSGSDAGEPPPEMMMTQMTEEEQARMRLTGVLYIPPADVTGEPALIQAEDKYIRHVRGVRQARTRIDARTPHGYRDYRAKHPAGTQRRGPDSMHTWLSGRGMTTSIAPLSTISVPKPKVGPPRDPDAEFREQVRLIEQQMVSEPRCLAHKLMAQLSPDRPKDDPYTYVFGVPDKYNPDIDASATRIQSLYRGRSSRRSVQSDREDQAATRIQAGARGRQTRRVQAEARRKRETKLAAYEAEVFAEVWSVLTHIKDCCAVDEDREKARMIAVKRKQGAEFAQLMMRKAIEKVLEHAADEAEEKSKQGKSKWKMAMKGAAGGSGVSLAKAGKRIRRASVVMMAALGRNKSNQKDTGDEQAKKPSTVGKMLRRASLVMLLGKGKQQQVENGEEEASAGTGDEQAEEIKNNPALAAVAAASADEAQKTGKKAVKALKKRVRRASIVLLATKAGSVLKAVTSEKVQQKAAELESLKKQKQEIETAAVAASAGNIDAAAVIAAAAATANGISPGASPRSDTAAAAPPEEESESEEDDFDPPEQPEPALSQTDAKMEQEPEPEPALERLSLVDGSLRAYTPGNTPPDQQPEPQPHPKPELEQPEQPASKARSALLNGLRSGELEAAVAKSDADAAAAVAAGAATATAAAEAAAMEAERQRLAEARRLEGERLAAEEAAAAAEAQAAAEHEAFLKRVGVPSDPPGRGQ